MASCTFAECALHKDLLHASIPVAQIYFQDDKQQLNNTGYMAIGSVTRRPLPWLLVWQLVTCQHVTLIAKVTVVSTTARLTVERSSDLATVGRTRMEASLA